MESAKLVKVMGEPLRAVQELENSMRLLGMLDETPNILDLTMDDDESKIMKAKVYGIFSVNGVMTDQLLGASSSSPVDE